MSELIPILSLGAGVPPEPPPKVRGKLIYFESDSVPNAAGCQCAGIQAGSRSDQLSPPRFVAGVIEPLSQSPAERSQFHFQPLNRQRTENPLLIADLIRRRALRITEHESESVGD